MAYIVQGHHSWMYRKWVTIKQEDTSLKVFDTTQIHARRAALKAIE